MSSKHLSIFSVLIYFLFCSFGYCGNCPLDHFLIGRNQDGINGTEDDNKLFVDCFQKYRHSDPLNSGEDTWLNWYYPMYFNPRYSRYEIGEPGFDIIDSNDPNRCLQGIKNVDYQIIIECVSIKQNFITKNSLLGIQLDEPGDSIPYSSFTETHIHLEYRAPSPSGGTDLQWITYRIYDNFGTYEASEPFSIVFVKEPLAGDLAINGTVDAADLSEFCYYWLENNGSKSNDYYERADSNRDGKVDFLDFAMIASNWLETLQ